MKNIITILLLLIFTSSSHGEKLPKRILYLNSYHQSMTWASDVTKGVEETLNSQKENFILHIENMDTKRHHSKNYYKSLANLYKNKYSNIKFDLILASDNNAFDFLKKYRDEIFGDIAVSFSGVNNFSNKMLVGYDNYTGVAEVSSEVETVELILKLHPNTKNIYIINDYLKTGRAWQETIEKNLAPFEKKINLIYNKNITLKSLQNVIKTLPVDSVILMGVYFADKNNQYITYEKMGKFLLDRSSVPVYALTDFAISDGVVGGKVLSGYQHGIMMTKLGLSILQGINPNKIEIVKDTVNKFVFNEIALNKFNINRELLPKKYTMINKSTKVTEKYSIAFSVLIFVLFSIVILFVFVFYKKGIENEHSIVRILIYGPVIFIPTIITILTYTIINNNQQIHKEELKNLQSINFKEQKQLAINKVEEVSSYILTLKTKKEVLSYINNHTFGKSGYLFAFTKNGLILAHGTDKKLINKNVLDFQDANGVKLFQELIRNAITNSYQLVEYIWRNPQTKQNETKYSYSKYIPKYDFVVGTGVYIEDIKKTIRKKTIELNKRNEVQIENIVKISVVIMIVSVIIAILLSNYLKNIFKKYNKKIDRKNEDLTVLNNSLKDKIKDEVKKSHDKDMLLAEQSKMASMGEMIGNIAHQWRQPLSVISTAATGMKIENEYDLLTTESINENCDRIDQNAQYLSKTIDDFRNFIKNDKIKSTFNLTKSIDSFLHLVEGSIKKDDINIILELDDTIEINGYENELVQCLINIFNNAKDILSENKVSDKCVLISTTIENKQAIIKIVDNAGGVPKEIINRIFEPYFTTKHQCQGTGLGLHMTYNLIVDGMKGKIVVQNIKTTYKNNKYTGAEFVITVPIS